MIPTSLLAVVVFAASIGPGYVWVRVAEKRTPRPDRTPLLEAAELIIVGGFASTLSFFLVLLGADWTGWADLEAFADEGTRYAIEHPSRGIGAFLTALTLAYLGAWVVARSVYSGQPPLIKHGYSAWHDVLGYKPGRDVYATVDLEDGTTVAGWVYRCTVQEGPIDERELVLADARGKKILVRPPGEQRFYESPDSCLVVHGADVLRIGASPFPSRARVRPRRFPGLGWLSRNGRSATNRNPLRRARSRSNRQAG